MLGPLPEVEAFCAAHVAGTDTQMRVTLRMRLFRLGTLMPPVGVRDAGRLACETDLDLLGPWLQAFEAEIAHDDAQRRWTDPSSPRELVARSLRVGAGVVLWEVDGEVVSQASARRPVAGMSRIGAVYTPPEHRRHGYAAAVTAAATRWALDAGARQVLLFTDLANPTTNALYPRLGYRPEHDAMEVVFTHPTHVSPRGARAAPRGMAHCASGPFGHTYCANGPFAHAGYRALCASGPFAQAG